MAKHFDSVIGLVCRYLPSDIAEARSLIPEFDYYYQDAIPLKQPDDGQEFLDTHEKKVESARQDLKKLLKRYKVNDRDVLCYPSIDYYSLHALADSIEDLKRAGPTVMMRLIGVMETAASGAYAKPMNVTLALLGRLLSAGVKVKIAAETPRYAEYLAVNLNCEVFVAANIETRDQLPLPETGHFTVICPGSSRYDKGFLDLAEIFSSVRRRDPDMKIRFVTQLLPDRDLQHQLDYLQRLYSIPGVTILPSQISAEEMEEMFVEADLVLLPYAADVYELRGSAALIEAMCSGRHVLAFEGPAFVDQMLYFGCGEACKNVNDMANKIIEFSRKSPQMRYAKARQARSRFMKDLAASYGDWVF